jgi:APA family basic amino acid/polyamine antiporter
LVYILGTFTLMGIIPPAQLQHSYSPFADAADRMWGPLARNWVAGTAVVASFGALNGWILIQGQMPHAAARDQLFPPLFARENARKSPVAAIVLSSVLVSILMVMNFTKGLVEQFQFLILLSTLTCLVPYLFSMAAFVLLVIDSRKKGETGYHGSIVLGLLAFGFTFWAIAGCGANVVYPGFLCLIAGIPIYLWMRWHKKKSS